MYIDVHERGEINFFRVVDFILFFRENEDGAQRTRVQNLRYFFF